MNDLRRCDWATTPSGIAYHDSEWGVPRHDDRVLFEFLILEGAQAGLSWETILRKREAYRRAFASFDPARVARFDKMKIARLMADGGIVRNRLKIESAVKNAKAGQVTYRVDKAGIVHCSIGKANFEVSALKENLHALIADLQKAKPASSKGVYLKRVTLSSTMGPGVVVDQASI